MNDAQSRAYNEHVRNYYPILLWTCTVFIIYHQNVILFHSYNYRFSLLLVWNFKLSITSPSLFQIFLWFHSLF